MRFAVLLVCLGCVVVAQSPPPSPRPQYVESSIVNAANPGVPVLAPNTLATIYGAGLAWGKKALSEEDIATGLIPSALPGAGVRVTIGGLLAPLLYVSPNQVNLLVPAGLPDGRTELTLSLDGRSGPTVPVTIAAISPALFQADPEFAVASRADGSLITPKSPAAAGDIVILYATGLGRTRPAVRTGEIVRAAAPVERRSEFQVTLDGIPVAPEDILYAGAAPGFAGLYQINLRLPATVGRNPEVRCGFREERSPSGLRLSVAN